MYVNILEKDNELNAINFSVGNLYKRNKTQWQERQKGIQRWTVKKKIKSKQSKGKGQGTTLYSALKKDHGKINKEQMISFEIRYLSL